MHWEGKLLGGSWGVEDFLMPGLSLRCPRELGVRCPSGATMCLLDLKDWNRQIQDLMTG